MPDYTDMGAFVLAKLRATAAVTALIVSGAAGILDAGELTGEFLNESEQTRQTSQAAQALAVVVVDTGETGTGGNKTASTAIYIYDRQRGYTNLRAVREAVITALVNQPVTLVRSAYINMLFYASRTGLIQFVDFDLDYEAVSISGALTYSKSSEYYA